MVLAAVLVAMLGHACIAAPQAWENADGGCWDTGEWEEYRQPIAGSPLTKLAVTQVAAVLFFAFSGRPWPQTQPNPSPDIELRPMHSFILWNQSIAEEGRGVSALSGPCC
jgi:hypothetical protein